MNNQGYTFLGWVVWQIGRRVARRKLAANRVKVGAAAAVTLTIVAAIAVAASSSDEE